MTMKQESNFSPHLAEPRRTAQANFPDGRTFEAPRGTTLEQYIWAALGVSDVPVIAALLDGTLQELSHPLDTDANIVPIYLSDSDGVRIYRRSLSFLLVTAIQELFPDVDLHIDYAVPSGGFFCRLRGREPFSRDELRQIERRMQEIVDLNVRIDREQVRLDGAREMFEKRGETEKIALLTQRKKDYLPIYSLRQTRNYFHGYMVPSTGYLRYFALQPWAPGFVLQYPRRHEPTVIQPIADSPQLMAAFEEYSEWLRLLGVESVSGLNEAIDSQRIREIVLVSEALHEQRIADIADRIVERRPETRLVLIAGPSAAGKTTFSKRLSIQLLAHGVHPFPLELDNYFVERSQTPLDAEGNYDFEALEALDLELFNDHLAALMEGKKVQLPLYNFETGQREAGESVQLGPEHVILLEGIHGMNPRLVTSVPRDCTFRIFVSDLTQLNIDRHNRVPTTDTRLIRRIVRDATYRGYTAEETLNRWESVRRGEKQYIFPYQDQADVMFNSALVFELAVLKPLAKPLLLQVEASSSRQVETKRLLAFLRWFKPCGPEMVPDNSILREFIGGSILRDYVP